MGNLKQSYMIVTNDEYELPVTFVLGISGIAEFLEVPEATVRTSLKRGWSHLSQYKAIKEPDVRTEKQKETDRKKREQECNRRSNEKRKQSGYWKIRYQKKKEATLQ